jgi:TRAP-type mannitol/chloroaromatic compound transport system permease large subunit
MTTPVGRLSKSERASALIALLVIGGLLGGVAAGYFFAVEAAAMGAFVLFVASVATRRLDFATLRIVLAEAMSVAGTLFALLIAATTFTLVFRAFGSDRLLDAWIAAMPGGRAGLLVAALGFLVACALVLDAFEIVFVVIPILMPPLLAREPDAVWVSVATLMVLQASFLIPPIGYAVMMTRSLAAPSMPMRMLARSLAPYAIAQLAVLTLVVAAPAITHMLDHEAPAATVAPEDADFGKQLERNEAEQRKEREKSRESP